MNRPAAARSIEAVVVLAGVGAAALVSSGAPTGIGIWDAVLRIGFVLAMAGFGRKLAPRWWCILGLPSLVFVGMSWWLLPVLAALFLAAATHRELVSGERSGLLAGGLLGLALLHFSDLGFWGASAVMAAIVFVLAGLASGSARSLLRPRVWRTLTLTGIALSVLLVVTGLGTYRGLSDGATASDRALAAQRSGRIDDAETNWQEAAVAFDAARTSTTGFWVQPIRLMPVLGQHLNAAASFASAGQALSEGGVEFARDLDFRAWVDGTGKIDTAQIAAAETAVLGLNTLLFESEVELYRSQSPWMLGAVHERAEEALSTMSDARTDGEIVAEALRLLPEAVGAGQPKTYLVVFGNPAEAREMGGLLSAYALARYDNGRLTIVEAAVNDRLVRDIPKDPLDTRINYSTAYLEYDLVTHPLNLTGTPDIAQMFDATRDVFPSYLGRVDGMIYLDPFALEALIGMGPPLRLADSSVVLNGETTADYLLRTQYQEFPASSDRETALLSVFEESVRGLVGRLFANPSRVEQVLAPLIDARRIQMVSADVDATNPLLERIGLLHHFEATPGRDFLGVFQANQGENKLDAYSSKDVVYSVRLNPTTKSLVASLRVHVSSMADATLPEAVRGTGTLNDQNPGANHMVLSVYSPHRVESGEVDGVPVSVVSIRDYGMWRHSVTVVVPPQGDVRFDLTLVGQFAYAEPEEGEALQYELDLWSQPLVEPDVTTVSVAVADAWRIEGARSAEAVTQAVGANFGFESVAIVRATGVS